MPCGQLMRPHVLVVTFIACNGVVAFVLKSHCSVCFRFHEFHLKITSLFLVNSKELNLAEY